MAPSTCARALVVGFLLLSHPAPAQQRAPEASSEIIVSSLADLEEVEGVDLQATFDLLSAYHKRPLDLNRATADELAELHVLTALQIKQLLQYRERLGSLLSVYELQVIPALDLETIRLLRPFIRVGSGGLDDTKATPAHLLRTSERELFLRWHRRLERARGYRLPATDSTNAYLGDPNRYFLKFRTRYGNRLSLGFVAEKDAGEPFLRGPNRRRGFDYWSGHFFLRHLNRRVKALALGDFTVSFGQGLIRHGGFGFGKSSQTTNVARGGRVLRPYAGVNEFGFLRGAGVTLAVGRHGEWTLFGSRRRRTGRVIEMAEPQLGTRPQAAVSALNASGFHRTPGEVADRNAVRQTSYGTVYRYRPTRNLRLGLNVLGEHLSHSLEPRRRTDNYYAFRGTDLLNGSVDYRAYWRNLSFFGEVAGSWSGQSGIAMLHGMQLGLDRSVDLALVYRNYGLAYQALAARPFGETSGGRNEQGMYVGLELRPTDQWKLSAYYDLWRHDWLRYHLNGPSGGREWRLRLTHLRKRRSEAYLEVRSETKGAGTDKLGATTVRIDAVVPRTRLQTRLHFRYQLSKSWDWRSRLDWGYTETTFAERETGTMLYQELVFRPEDSPWRFNARMATFHTDGYDVRFYQYEAGLTYNAFVLPYYGKGTRSYVVVRYKGFRGLTLEGRVAQTVYAEDRTLGSGLERIEGRRRTQVATQAIWRF